MDESAVKEIAEAYIEPLMRKLGIPHWKITLAYGPIDGGFMALCHRDTEYNKATITLDPRQHDDEAEVIDSLTHELMHVVHSPFDLFWDVALQLTDDKHTIEMLQKVWSFACEQTRINLNRMYLGIEKAERS